MTQKLEVATEILRQLKVLPVPKMGFSFLLLTGANKFAGDENTLRFNIKHKNHTGINTIRITLNTMDAYDIEFWDCRVLRKSPWVVNELKDTAKDVYAEDLPAILAEKVRLS